MSLNIRGLKNRKDVVEEQRTYTEKRRTGEITSMRTPWRKINAAGIDGWEWGWCVLIGGEPGTGKTAVANQLSSFVAKHGITDTRVLLFTLEMASIRLVAREMSHKLNKRVKDIYLDKDEIDKEIWEELLELDNIDYMDVPPTPTQFHNIVQDYMNYYKDKKVLVIVDHLNLFEGEGADKEITKVTKLANKTNKLKKTYHERIMFVLISQLKKEFSNYQRRSNPALHYPTRDDLYMNSVFDQLSDFMMFLVKPHNNYITVYGPDKYPADGYIYAHIIKGRDSDTGLCIFKDDLANNDLRELTVEEKENFNKLTKSNRGKPPFKITTITDVTTTVQIPVKKTAPDKVAKKSTGVRGF